MLHFLLGWVSTMSDLGQISSFDNSDVNKLLAALRTNLCRAMPQEMKVELCGGHILIFRFEHEHKCSNASIYKPMITFMISGQKNSAIGDSLFTYNPGDIFISGVDIPAQFMVKNVSHEQPGFSVSIFIDPAMLQEIMSQLPPLNQQELLNSEFSAHSDTATAAEILTLSRIVDLYTNGVNYDFPYSLLLKELYFYVLTAKHGMSLRKIFTNGAQDYKIAKAIHYLRENFRDDVAIENLAGMVYMAVPTFYKHFKQVTAMSPLQYLKRLRLYEAKRLMISNSLTAAAAGYEVGYSSEQHFSRDYKKLFGRPPLQDIKESTFVPYHNPFTDAPANVELPVNNEETAAMIQA